MPDEVKPEERWITDRYAEWYRRNPPPLPDRFTRREFGFLFFGQKFMLRHVGFPTQRDFLQFLVRNGPAHSYYSTAYYKTPNARTMAEKGWLGAELIFDLDADHVPGAEKLPYRQQLEKVKFHFLRLVEDFILRDFGFVEKDLLLTFSGGRGYHCHVMAEKALQLTSQERREIVDYVTGTGLDLDRFIRPRTLRSRSFRTKAGREVDVADRTLSIPTSKDPAWGRRINGAIREKAAELRSMEPEVMEHFLKGGPFPKVTKARLITLAGDLERLTDERIESGFVDVGEEILKYMTRTLTADNLVPLAKGETDEPVTSDTKRLIRLPGSLHGKSALRVVNLRLDQVRAFDPLVDAVAFSDEPTRINVVKPSKIDVAGFVADLPLGPATVPEQAALMLVARGAATPVL